ncbi:MAG: succinate--CoA ligase subunit alpha [Spirochaetales bacterium]|nr:succinate--CoA ligase subunit alpha [Spirochaetales bacterium]
MSILIDKDTPVMVQGITGRDGSFHARSMKKDGTRVVGGVTPGKGGTEVDDLPVFDTVTACVAATGAQLSVLFVPPAAFSAAFREALDGGIKTLVCVTEGVPVHQMIDNLKHARERGVRVIGANSPGLISPGKAKAGIMPAAIHLPGRIGVISRSGTLTYEIVSHLSAAGLGQSTCVGIGGDSIVGTGFIDLLTLFEADEETDAVVLIGEIGGDAEEKAAQFVAEKMRKPVAAFIAGRTALPGKRMGHAGAIISSGGGTAASKITAFREAGVPVADLPRDIPALLRELLP